VSEMEVFAYRMQVVENAVMELRAAHKSIAESLQQLVLLEREHAHTRAALDRAFKAIKGMDDRLQVIERQMPKHHLVVGWVLAFVLAAAGAAGGLVWKAVVQREASPQVIDRRPVPTEPAQ
jgi:hypothetical protein